MFIDTHCHLDCPPLYARRDEVIGQAKAAGVTQIITIGTDLKSSQTAVEIADEFPAVFAAVGIHPTEIYHCPKGWHEKLIELTKHPKVKAVGEIGLDYYWQTTKAVEQKQFLHEQIEIAKKIKLPIILHNRRADNDIKSILIEHGYYRGVLHCYSSDEYFAKEMLDLGLYISFTGSITYGSKRLQRALSIIPINRLMLETDAPYITPEPYKGSTNEPKYIPLIAAKIAEIKNLPLHDIEEGTTKTAREFFNL
jgi:TatD DNase family protein